MTRVTQCQATPMTPPRLKSPPPISHGFQAPYAPKDLSVPLTPKQRTDIIAWLVEFKGGDRAKLSAYGDAAIIEIYTGIWILDHGLEGIRPPNKKDFEQIPGVGAAISVGDFLGRLTDPNFWVRAGEITVGVILLGVGVSAVLKNKPAQGAQRVGFQHYFPKG